MGRSALFLLITALHLRAIDIRIYSEFQRVDSTGAVLPQDRAASTREVLSPAVVRNGFATFRVVVTAAPNTLYFLAVQTNPPGVFRIKLHRESARALIEERDPSFLAGVTPFIGRGAAETANAYLLDIWVPAGANPGVVRLEALVKTAYWKVAPMEIRVLPVVAPSLASCTSPAIVRDDGQPSDAIAFGVMLAGLAGDLPACVPAPATVPSVIARNASQDSALARMLDARPRAALLTAIREALSERAWALFHPRGSESYLAVRQLLQREASAHRARHADILMSPRQLSADTLDRLRAR
jgi:hypothetical protein